MTSPDDRLDCSDMDRATDDRLLRENTALRARVEALTAERQRDALDGQAAMDLAETIAKLEEAQETIRRLEKQWHDAAKHDGTLDVQARCTALEEAVKEILPFAASWLQETYGDDYVQNSSYLKAQHALAGREGGP